jgi:protein-export membrane protein SecD
MLYFQPWKVLLIVVVCVLGVILALPNMFSQTTLAAWPSWVPSKQVSLGLDLRGGSYLLFEVDMAGVERDRLNNVVDDLRRQFQQAKIGYTGGFTVDAQHIAFSPRDPSQMQDIRDIIRKIDAKLQITVAANGDVEIKPDEVALEDERQQAVKQSIEIVRRRIDELGTKEPSIQQEGSDRILVQLPGIDNPEEVKRVIGQTAHMTFQMVDEDHSPDNAKPGQIPLGDEILPYQDAHGNVTQRTLLVQKHIAVDGAALTDAQFGYGGAGNEPVVKFKFDSSGGRKFAEVTSKNVGKRFAIVLDKKVISAPVIRDAIMGGQGEISGSFTPQSANDLAVLLRAGALPAALTILQESSVGPDLGTDSIHAGALSCLIGVILVVLFMVVFYGLFGLFADIALFFNLCIMLAVLSVLGATLTLPGIAGIALTLGMAVDANVLIYERIREELRGGRTMISSLQAGFERAFGTILDSHVTTLVAGALMFVLGSGPIKGFAVTLSIGVITSLFSAILVTRLQIVTWLRRTKPKAVPI